MPGPMIINCTITGNITPGDNTSHLQVTPIEIADICLEAADNGAVIAP